MITESDVHGPVARCSPADVADIIWGLSCLRADDSGTSLEEWPAPCTRFFEEPMATCPECDAEIEVDEFDVDKGDQLSCPECGSTLEVTGLSPIELELSPDDDDEDEDEEDEEEAEDDELDDEEEEDEE